MPYTKNSSNWANGDVPDEADLDAWETGIDGAHEMADLAGLGIGKLSQTASGPSLLMLLYAKAAAFTFGTAPVTSAGYLRTPGGGPWGADSVSGARYDRTPASGSSTSTSEAVVDNQIFLFPAFNASITVTKLEIECYVAYKIGNAAYAATLTKMGLQVVKIAADGTETSVGSEVFDTSATGTDGDDQWKGDQAFLSASGFSQAIATTERLGFRLKAYGYTSNAAASIQAKCLADTVASEWSGGSYDYAWQTKGTPVAVWFT